MWRSLIGLRFFHATAALCVRRVIPRQLPAARPSSTEVLPAWVRDFKSGEPVGFVNLRKIIFGLPVRRDILQRVVVWQLAKRRSGNHKTKGRNEVRGSTKKMGPQKGSGGARHGTKRAPIFVGGGIAHGPVVRSHAFKLNKKVRSLGLRTALSAKFLQNDGLVIVEDSTLVPDSSKTKPMAKVLEKLGWLDKRTLFVTGPDVPRNLDLSIRNLPLVRVLPVQGLNVYDIIRSHRIVLTRETLHGIEKRFQTLLEPPSRTMPFRKPSRLELFRTKTQMSPVREQVAA